MQDFKILNGVFKGLTPLLLMVKLSLRVINVRLRPIYSRERPPVTMHVKTGWVPEPVCTCLEMSS